MYYVRADGADSNNGLTNSPAGAWLTIQHAIDVISRTIDFAGFHVTVQIGDGTYNGAVVCQAPLTGIGSSDSLTITGNSNSPSSVVLNISSAPSKVGIQVSDGCQLKLSNFKIQVSSLDAAIWGTRNGQINFDSGMNFGPSPDAIHIWVTDHGRVVGANRTVSGGGKSHVHVDTMGVFFDFDNAVTSVGSPSFTGAIHDCYLGGNIETSEMSVRRQII